MESEKKVPKTISVMLDVSGTSTCIDDQTAQIFIKQLEKIRLHFGADMGIISIATSFADQDSNSIRYILDTLARNLTGNIVIGLNFLMGATYDYEKDAIVDQGFGLNANKVNAFDEQYVSNPEYDNQWFALIDDSLYRGVYLQYRETHPMFMCRPTKEENKTSFMTYDTQTRDIDGVIEGLDHYIETIKNMSREEILNRQMYVLSFKDLKERIENGDFDFLKHFLSEGYAEDEDCNAILEIFRKKYNFDGISKEELKEFSEILDLLYTYYEGKKDEMGLLKVSNFKNITEDC